ncbi:uncharacterized protein LOC134856509 [Symsagittifera roscoffensis]|uniref:uncharacterized protein LOC134856509 n=1 Tax=Symsagittifera roscoffensis TaxID=84072 RepID=UPI00307B7937
MMAIEGEKLGKHCTKNIITEEPMQCQVTIEGLERAQRYIVIISIYIYDKLLPVSTTDQMETMAFNSSSNTLLLVIIMVPVLLVILLLASAAAAVIYKKTTSLKNGTEGNDDAANHYTSTDRYVKQHTVFYLLKE